MRVLLIYVTLSIVLAFAGCMSMPKVESTQPWEGHYMTKEAAQKAAEEITLGKNESVWILSNQTLSRLLRNTGK